MKKKMLVMMTVAILVMLFAFAASAEVMYVKTQSGSNVRVRAEPSVEAECWKSVPYGQAVDVLETENGWSLCEIPGYSNPGYIASRYLTRQNPGSRPNNNSDNNNQNTGDGSVSYRGFHAVDHYTVFVNHQTSTFLNLRWAPSESEAIIRRCYNGTELTVLAESNGWYQVYDEESGFAGFMRPKYLEPCYY